MRYIDSFKVYKELILRERELNRSLLDTSIENSEYLRIEIRLREIQLIRKKLRELTSVSGKDNCNWGLEAKVIPNLVTFPSEGDPKKMEVYKVGYKCPFCGSPNISKYCPECGARIINEK